MDKIQYIKNNNINRRRIENLLAIKRSEGEVIKYLNDLCEESDLAALLLVEKGLTNKKYVNAWFKDYIDSSKYERLLENYIKDLKAYRALLLFIALLDENDCKQNSIADSLAGQLMANFEDIYNNDYNKIVYYICRAFFVKSENESETFTESLYKSDLYINLAKRFINASKNRVNMADALELKLKATKLTSSTFKYVISQDKASDYFKFLIANKAYDAAANFYLRLDGGNNSLMGDTKEAIEEYFKYPSIHLFASTLDRLENSSLLPVDTDFDCIEAYYNARREWRTSYVKSSKDENIEKWMQLRLLFGEMKGSLRAGDKKAFEALLAEANKIDFELLSYDSCCEILDQLVDIFIRAIYSGYEIKKLIASLGNLNLYNYEKYKDIISIYISGYWYKDYYGEQAISNKLKYTNDSIAVEKIKNALFNIDNNYKLLECYFNSPLRYLISLRQVVEICKGHLLIIRNDDKWVNSELKKLFKKYPLVAYVNKINATSTARDKFSLLLRDVYVNRSCDNTYIDEKWVFKNVYSYFIDLNDTLVVNFSDIFFNTITVNNIWVSVAKEEVDSYINEYPEIVINYLDDIGENGFHHWPKNKRFIHVSHISNNVESRIKSRIEIAKKFFETLLKLARRSEEDLLEFVEKCSCYPYENLNEFRYVDNAKISTWPTITEEDLHFITYELVINKYIFAFDVLKYIFAFVELLVDEKINFNVKKSIYLNSFIRTIYPLDFFANKVDKSISDLKLPIPVKVKAVDETNKTITFSTSYRGCSFVYGSSFFGARDIIYTDKDASVITRYIKDKKYLDKININKKNKDIYYHIFLNDDGSVKRVVCNTKDLKLWDDFIHLLYDLDEVKDTTDNIKKRLFKNYQLYKLKIEYENKDNFLDFTKLIIRMFDRRAYDAKLCRDIIDIIDDVNPYYHCEDLCEKIIDYSIYREQVENIAQSCKNKLDARSVAKLYYKTFIRYSVKDIKEFVNLIVDNEISVERIENYKDNVIDIR